MARAVKKELLLWRGEGGTSSPWYLLGEKRPVFSWAEKIILLVFEVFLRGFSVGEILGIGERGGGGGRLVRSVCKKSSRRRKVSERGELWSPILILLLNGVQEGKERLFLLLWEKILLVFFFKGGAFLLWF